MQDTQIQLSALWTALMLVYLLGDVMRMFSGDFKKMSKDVKWMNQYFWFATSAIMLIPILMVILSVFLPYEINRWANIIVSIGFFLFNIAGLPTYPSLYDRFLILVSLLMNVAIVWVAWSW